MFTQHHTTVTQWNTHNMGAIGIAGNYFTPDGSLACGYMETGESS
jgi:hypothetical protein